MKRPVERVRAGGITFEIGPSEHLTEGEREALARLPRCRGEAGTFRIDLTPAPPWTSDDPRLFPRMEPAVQAWVDGRLRMSHHSFVAEIDVFGRGARLFRRESRAYPLEATLRAAMMSRLPIEGGLPLHAAGVSMAGRGVAFFGVSGAGKSTLAGLSPHPVLSDELVAVLGSGPPMLLRTGFWGAHAGPSAPDEVPLVALVALEKGPRFELRPMAPRAALRRLLQVVTVPLASSLWQHVLRSLDRLVTACPVYRMAWSPREPPWEHLEAALTRNRRASP